MLVILRHALCKPPRVLQRLLGKRFTRSSHYFFVSFLNFLWSQRYSWVKVGNIHRKRSIQQRKRLFSAPPLPNILSSNNLSNRSMRKKAAARLQTTSESETLRSGRGKVTLKTSGNTSVSRQTYKQPLSLLQYVLFHFKWFKADAICCSLQQLEVTRILYIKVFNETPLTWRVEVLYMSFCSKLSSYCRRGKKTGTQFCLVFFFSGHFECLGKFNYENVPAHTAQKFKLISFHAAF